MHVIELIEEYLRRLAPPASRPHQLRQSSAWSLSSPHTATGYQTHTVKQLRMPNGTESSRQTTHALPHLTRPKTYQLNAWLNKAETHEQAVVGEKTSRKFAKTMNFLEEMERRVDGHTK
ncbi:hypothetical protein HO173_009599 [Letharia columbiana]|uniref:Uncharacterized protein n=1 Tax=Letharia columbiana TaxID=112416 RepID=A0A8H6FPH4_9LECA|nr:uncharacterized protein HO173_009599 [Letharia columbiana]KAF6232216.1 hypothetical protein HO173_009599 [Letharia columbiana]